MKFSGKDFALFFKSLLPVAQKTGIPTISKQFPAQNLFANSPKSLLLRQMCTTTKSTLHQYSLKAISLAKKEETTVDNLRQKATHVFFRCYLHKAMETLLKGKEFDQKKIFFSYSWKENSYPIRMLAEDLLYTGQLTWIDYRKLDLGSSVFAEIKQGMNKSDILLLMCDKAYVEKYEANKKFKIKHQEILYREAMEFQRHIKENSKKVINVLLEGDKASSIPDFSQETLYSALTESENYYDIFFELCRVILGIKPTEASYQKIQQDFKREISKLEAYKEDELKEILRLNRLKCIEISKSFYKQPEGFGIFSLRNKIWGPEKINKNSYFVNRIAAESSLTERLLGQNDNCVMKSIVISGFSGTGKTQFANQYVHLQAQNNFYDRTFWIRSADRSNIVETLKKLAIDHFIPVQDFCDTSEKMREFYLMLTDKYKKILFVFDNVEHYTESLACFPREEYLSAEYLHEPDKHCFHVIYTTVKNNLLPPGKSYFADPIDMECFTKKEATIFFQEWSRVAPAFRNDTVNLQLAKELDYHPLALQLAVYFIRTRGITIAEYIAGFKSENATAVEMLKDMPKDEEFLEQYAVLDDQSKKYIPKTAWIVCDRSMKEIEKHGSGHSLLVENVSRYLPPSNIPEVLFEPLFKVDRPNMLGNIRKATQALFDFGLIRKDKSTDGAFQVLSYFQVVQRIKSEASAKKDKLAKGLSNALLCLSSKFNLDREYNTEDWQKAEIYFSHADRVISYIEKKWDSNPDLRFTKNEKQWINQLCMSLGHYQCYAMGGPKESVSAYQRRLKFLKDVFKQDSESADYAWAYYDLGLAYEDFGQYQADLNMQDRALSIVTRLLDKAHPQSLTKFELIKQKTKILLGICSAHYRKGEYGYKSQEQDIDDYMNQVQNNIDELKSMLTENSKFKDKYEKIVKKIEARFYGRKGTFAYATGRYAEAYTFQDKTRKLRLDLYNNDENNPYYAITLSNMGNAYYGLGNFDAAEKCYKEALDVFSGKNFRRSDTHYRRIVALSRRARNYLALEKHEEAKTCSEEALRLHRKLYGEDTFHHEALYAYLVSARCDLLKGELTKGLVSLEKALKIGQDAFSENLHIAMKYKVSPHAPWPLASLLQEGWTGKDRPEDEKLKHLKKIMENIYGKEHIEIARINTQIGDIYKFFGERKLAKYYFSMAAETAKKYYKEFGIDSHPNMRRIIESLELLKDIENNFDPSASSGEGTKYVHTTFRRLGLWDKNRNFTSRVYELSKLDEFFNSSGADLFFKQAILVGQGGIGKTQLAVEYAHKYAKNYDCIIWLRMEKLEEIQTGFRRLTSLVEYPMINLANKSEIEEFYYKLMRTFPKVLMILDDVANKETIYPFLPKQWERVGAHKYLHIILTSRYANWGHNFTLIMDSFSPQEAETYFLKITKKSDPDIPKLCARLSHYPLALSQAAYYIRSCGISCKEYLILFDKFIELRRHIIFPADPYLYTIGNTWRVSIDKIYNQSKVAFAIYIICANLNTNNIPGALFKVIEENLVNLEDKKTDYVVNQALELLTDYSCLKKQDLPFYFKIHPLLRECLNVDIIPDFKERLGDEYFDNLTRLTAIGLSELLFLPRHELEKLDNIPELTPHIKEINHVLSGEKFYHEKFSLLCRWGDYEFVVNKKYLDAKEIYSEHKSSEDDGVLGELWRLRVDLCDDPENYKVDISKLKELIALENKISALSFNQKAIHNLNEIRNSIISLSIICYEIGKYEDALILAEYVRAFDFSRCEELTFYLEVHLGKIYMRLGNHEKNNPKQQGVLFEKASCFFESARKIISSDDGEHTVVGTLPKIILQYNIARLFRSRKEFYMAYDVMEEVIKKCVYFYGEKSVRTTIAYAEKSRNFLANGEYEEAKSAAIKAYDNLKEKNKFNHFKLSPIYILYQISLQDGELILAKQYLDELSLIVNKETNALVKMKFIRDISYDPVKHDFTVENKTSLRGEKLIMHLEKIIALSDNVFDQLPFESARRYYQFGLILEKEGYFEESHEYFRKSKEKCEFIDNDTHKEFISLVELKISDSDSASTLRPRW